jgi:uncharacterized membrane protein
MTIQVHFHNSYGPRIWVALMFKDDGCGSEGRPWGTRGWWTIDNGADVHVLNTDNRYIYYYAEADNGAVWTGNFGPIYVVQQAFSSCVDIGRTDARVVGTREVYMPGDVHTVNLTG